MQLLAAIEIHDEMDDVEDMRVLVRKQWKKSDKTLDIEVEIKKQNLAEEGSPVNANKLHTEPGCYWSPILNIFATK
ncbi:MAG: hypothetical protein JXC33_13395 [Deltaproteobacteria bacterium]|nr:hypothetical protein [Deltaproteobacteria bacterium]